MSEETKQTGKAAPVHYPADGPKGVSAPSDRLRRQLIKGGAGTVLAVAAVWAGWTKILFPEGSSETEDAAPAPSIAAPPVAAGAARKLGALSSFPEGGAPRLVTLDGDHPQSYLVDNLGGGQFRVLSAACSHRGCTVGWSARKSCYICPCHFGQFARDGKNIGGPPPSPLPSAPARVENGDLVLA